MKYVQCPWCSREIPAETLVYHVVTAHAEADANSISCFCGQKLNSIDTLAVHLERLGVLPHLLNSTLYLQKHPEVFLRLCGVQ